jgi:fermentation-respiration switch protein FrsA (DUF1100 family)
MRTTIRITTRRLTARLRRVLIILLLAILVVCAGVFGVSGYMGWRLTHPARMYATTTPAASGLAYSDVTFTSATGGVRLSGWFMPSGQSTSTVILAHGYRQYRMNESASLPMAQVLVRHGFNVLAFDFRGCGKSGGNEVTLGQDEPGDILGAIAFLRNRAAHRPIRVGILGFSLGATTALEAARLDQADIRAVVSDSAFADLYAYVRDHADTFTHLPAMPFNRTILWVTPILTGLDPQKVNAVKAVQALPKTPLFFIAGTADTTISDRNSVDLYNAAASQHKTLWLVPGGTHAASYDKQPEEYKQRALAFFVQYLAGAAR